MSILLLVSEPVGCEPRECQSFSECTVNNRGPRRGKTGPAPVSRAPSAWPHADAANSTSYNRSTAACDKHAPLSQRTLPATTAAPRHEPYPQLLVLSMVRKYERMSGRQSWSEEDMAKAVAAVVSGKMGYKLAARTFHIPRSTLQRRASKIRYQLPDEPKPLMGHYRRVFTDNQEKDLVGYIKSMEKFFMGVSRRDIRELAFQYAEDNNLNHPFDVNSRMAGEDWVRNFLKRNPELLNKSEKEYELEPVNFDQFYHFMCQLS
ncbi:uncharacterized protein [Battus philenor]|uniref:uncharacterized protein n=1 Tax=Battus philenor TaxID=42288 RepID=UPI0035CFF8EE